MKIKRAISSLLLMAPLVSAQAGMIVTLSDNGYGFTRVNINGSGVTERAYDHNPGSVPRLVANSLRGPHPDSVVSGGTFPDTDFNTSFPALDFIGDTQLTGISFFEEGHDEFHFNLNPGASIAVGEAFDIDYTFDITAYFSSFNTGTYTPYADSVGWYGVYGAFELIVEPVSAPSSFALLGLGLLGLGYARKRAS